MGPDPSGERSLEKEEVRTDIRKHDPVRIQGNDRGGRPRREASGETDPVDTLILDSASRSVRSQVLLFKPPELWYLVTAAQAN